MVNYYTLHFHYVKIVEESESSENFKRNRLKILYLFYDAFQ